MNNFIIHLHSGLAYMVLLGLALVTIFGIIGLIAKKDKTKFDKIIVSATKGFVHLQGLVGIILWIVSDKVQAYMKDMGNTMTNTESRRMLL